MKVLSEMKELMQPLRGMGKADAIEAGVEIDNWQQL